MNEHGVPDPPETFQDRFRDAMSPRTLPLEVGALLLQFGFIASYIGAFHHPAPRRLPIPLLPSFWAVVGPALPNGAAGTDALRRITYFGGHGIHLDLIVLAIWIIGGTAMTLVASRLRSSATPMPQCSTDPVRQAGRVSASPTQSA